MITVVIRGKGVAQEVRIVDDGTPCADVNEFLESISIRGLSPRTKRAYAYDLLALLRWLKDTGERVETLSGKGILAFIDAQLQAGLSPHTINRRLVALKLFTRFTTGNDPTENQIMRPTKGYYKGRRAGWLGLHRWPRRDPMLRVKAPVKLVEPLTAAEVVKFIKLLSRYRDIAILQLLLMCGLRSCEVLSIKRVDVVFEDRRITVQGKGRKERALPLPAPVAATLQRYLKYERPTTDHDYLFVVLQGKRRGNPMTSAGLRSLFLQRRRKSHIHRANPHRFRHTFGVDMARAGVRLPILQKMMGHQDPTTTLRYINLSMDDVADAYLAAMDQIRHRYHEEKK